MAVEDQRIGLAEHGMIARTSVLCIDSDSPLRTSHFLRNMKLAKPSSFKLTMPFRTTWEFIDVSEYRFGDPPMPV